MDLIDAAKNGDTNMVELLLDKVADINVKENNGARRNALIYATDRGYIDIVQLLLDKGADINVHDIYDATPLIIATENEDKEMVKLLLDKGANTNIQESDGYTAFSTAVENGSADIVKLLEPHISSTKIQRIFRDRLTKRKKRTQKAKQQSAAARLHDVGFDISRLIGELVSRMAHNHDVTRRMEEEEQNALIAKYLGYLDSSNQYGGKKKTRKKKRKTKKKTRKKTKKKTRKTRKTRRKT